MDNSPAAAPLEARFQLNTDDFKAFRDLIQKASGALAVRRIVQVLLAVFAIVLVISIVFHWRLASSASAPIARIGADGLDKVFAVFIPIGLFMVVWALVMIRNYNVQLKNPMFKESTLITLEAGIITQKCGTSVNRIEWHDIRRVIASDTHLILTTLPNAGFIVPRRAFTSEADWQIFVSFAREQWQKTQPATPPIANA